MGSLENFLQAVVLAGLTDTLNSEEGFEALPGTMEEELFGEEHERLREIMLDHIAEGEYTSADLTPGETITMLSGKPLTIGQGDEGIMLGDVNIIDPDIEADNGVIHVINDVIRIQ